MSTEQRLPEVSVVIPCLNEAETVATCVGKAVRSMQAAGIPGEVIVADNGSTDGSCERAAAAGARVVAVGEKGYGNALMGGFREARGRFLMMADADDSYDLNEVPRFVTKLREGWDLVQGCRLPSGGGRVETGAMPWSHRWIGNPMFSRMCRVWFRAPVNDVYCGMRAFTREHYEALGLRCTGMEFATEMIIKSSLRRARIAEVPITLHKDGRLKAKSHLRTVRDGWRTLRFYLIFSPRWLFVLPGLLLLALGMLGFALALPRVSLFGVQPDAHTMIFASLAMLLGHQSLGFGVFAKTFGTVAGMLPPDPRFSRWFGFVNLERGILLGIGAALGGAALLALAVFRWYQADWGRLDYAQTMRIVVPGSTLVALGAQTILLSFLISLVRLGRGHDEEGPV